MDYKKDTSINLSFFANVSIIFISILVFALSNIYKYVIKKPTQKILNWLIEPMVDVLDNEYTGLIIIGIFMIEVLLTLIIPWFFSVWVGIIFVIYLILYFIFIIFVINEEVNKKIPVIIFIMFSLPYLILLFLPSLFIVIFRKRPEKQLTLLETRVIKLKRIKKKVRLNKFKFWK